MLRSLILFSISIYSGNGFGISPRSLTLSPARSTSSSSTTTLTTATLPVATSITKGITRSLTIAVGSSAATANTISSSNEDLLPGITAIVAANEEFGVSLAKVVERPAFRMFSVDILASCEYMPQQLFECFTEKCEIYPVEEEEVPPSIKEADLHEYDFELDGWARWDMPSDDYYDLSAFPDGYTGYDGSEIWSFIHNRICFEGYGYDDDHWKADFNKAVSGLHSLISVQVIRGIQDKLDAGEDFADEIWRDPKAEFERRMSANGETPLAMENLYFAYMLLLTAASKAKNRLLEDCEAGKLEPETAKDLGAVLASPLLSDTSVEVASRKLHDHAVKDSDSTEALWQARMRSRDLLRVMNCVQCNKCRLHGKIAILGLTTAFQILVGRSGEGGDPTRVHRVELAALISTLDKFSRAVSYCHQIQE